MKRILKWLGLVLLALIGIPALALLCVAGYYYHVVWQKPGALSTPITPTVLGSKVNVFSGTGGYAWVCAYDTPAACVPFGMVRLGPDTATIITNETGYNASGYFYGDNKIVGFSHTRLVGADALEGGIFRVFPATKPRGALKEPEFSRFAHRKETGFPGYYAVQLSDVLAEMTATTRVGVHRYTFSKGTTPHLRLDVTSALG
ncbi:MAG: hypothetical protein K1Y02_18870, partial [Candidatus Hydrogenedentes bacterium]|nr:hypothetical protein [Candidatus Hydrogenedentota bacterium]